MSIPKFETLYTIKNKKIYEWGIKINEIKKDTHYQLETHHGQKEGKKVVHTSDITVGKVKRTVLEQATQEAKRKWINKKEKELYSIDLKEIEKDFLEPEKQKKTNMKTFTFRPMLAKTFDPKLYEKKSSRSYSIPFPAYVQVKLDGLRCVSYLKDGNVIIESRTGKQFENFHKVKDQLKKIFNVLGENVYLDGELYTESIDFEVLSGLIRLTEEKVSKEQIQLIDSISYHIFDICFLDKVDMSYENRKLHLEQLLSLKGISLIKDVPSIEINSVNQIDVLHDKFVKDGYEGIMIRASDGPYEINKRSKYLQKYKKFMEEEFKIIDFHEGKGDEKGLVIWDCITNKEEKPFSVRPRGTAEQRKELYDNGKKYIGKKLTVIFQEYHESGVPRFPVGKAIRENY